MANPSYSKASQSQNLNEVTTLYRKAGKQVVSSATGHCSSLGLLLH